jgi:hypothetical protein
MHSTVGLMSSPVESACRDGGVLQQAGAVAATHTGPKQPFEVVTLRQIEPKLSVEAVHDGRVFV